MHLQDVARDVKHWMCFIPYVPLAYNNRKEYFVQYQTILPPPYELPDGTTKLLSNDTLCTLPESLLFPYHPTIPTTDPKLSHDNPYLGSSMSRSQALRDKIQIWNSYVSTLSTDSSIDSSSSSSGSSSSSSSNSISGIGGNPPFAHPSTSSAAMGATARRECEAYLATSAMTSYDTERDSLSDLIYASINMCDVEVRKELFSNILLVGGGSQMTGLQQRLVHELTELAPSHMKPRVIPTTPCLPIEKQCAAWIGGSILSICGSFQQEWLSKWEYNENGSDRIIAQNRFIH